MANNPYCKFSGFYDDQAIAICVFMFCLLCMMWHADMDMASELMPAFTEP